MNATAPKAQPISAPSPRPRRRAKSPTGQPAMVCATLIPRFSEGASAGHLRGRPLPSNGRLILGRGDDVHLRLSHATVSRWHARIEAERGRFWLIDLGSSNGTFLNGVLVQGAVALEDGDVLRFGSALLDFSSMETPIRDSRTSRPQVEDFHEAVTVQTSREELMRRVCQLQDPDHEAAGGAKILPGPHERLSRELAHRVA